MMETREAKLGFKPQKELIYTKFLPYASHLDEDSNRQLAEIKTNLGRAVLLRDIRPGSVYWVHRLNEYIGLFGRKFSKNDHICFIKVLYELITIPNLEVTLVQFFLQTLTNLLKKKELISPEEMELPWKPLYHLYESIAYSPYERLGLVLFPGPDHAYSKAITSLLKGLGLTKRWSTKMARLEGMRYIVNTLKTVIRMCQVYFPLSATQEMLDEWRPLLCPFDVSVNKAFAYFDLFLPTLLQPEHHNKGFKLWFEEFMGLWQVAHNSLSWEMNLIWLLSRLAVDNIGYIDWGPYIPMIFTKLLRCFNLPVGTQMQTSKSANGFEIVAACNFITAMLGGGSKCQEYLNKLFKALESYYHPSNNGKWNIKLNRLLYKLPVSFVKRIHRERFKKHTWEPVIPETHRITNAEVTEFVNSIRPCILLAMFSKAGSLHSATAVQNLSVLRPELIIPPLLERLYPALETLTEPHRLIASMQCMVSASRALLQETRFYPEGRLHVIPLLMCALPGIDPNDFKKCMVTFQFIFAFVTLIPIVDCSAAVQIRNDLTEQEQELCLATRELEDFVLQFMDKCFALIENSTLELVTKLDRETEKMNSQEGMLELMLTATFFSILTQCSDDIYKSALSKLKSFITGRVLETKVSGKLAANMCRGAAKAKPELALKTFLPYICKMILTLTSSEEILKEEVLDNELLFNMLLLSEIVCCSGQYLLSYQDQITQVLQRTLHLTSKPGYMLGGAILRHCLKSLTHISVLESRSIPHTFDKPFTEYLPIRDWGEPGDLDDLNIQWYVPSAGEKLWVKNILDQVLVPELDLLEKVINKETVLTREEIQQSLSIILDVILGAGALFPITEENHIELVHSKVPLYYANHSYNSNEELTIRNGKNVRIEIGNTVSKILGFIMNNTEDDTKSLFQIIQIYHNLMFFLGVKKDDFEARWKSFQFAKKAMENKFLGKKQHTRSLLIDRILMQHEMFILERIQSKYTPLHKLLMEDLLTLSTSHYSEVRTKAQSVLSNAFRVYSYSYRLFVPKVLKLLQNDPSISHEEFKGALYVILSNKARNILTQPDWNTLCDVWPVVIQAQHSEKPSIIRLIEDIREQIQKNLETISIFIEIPVRCLNQARELWDEGKPLCSLPLPESSQIADAENELKQTVEKNLSLYHKLVQTLVDLINSGVLRWRHHHMALCLLTLMLRCDVPLPAPAVKIFVNNLIHETLNVRKISIGAVAAILKQQKQKHKQIPINPFQVAPDGSISSSIDHSHLVGTKLLPGNRSDNEWMQFNSKHLPLTKEAWEKKVFVNKTHFGFYCWPVEMNVYAPYSEQPKLERDFKEMPLEEAVLFEFFNEPKNIDQWISFLSLEDRKGKDKFDSKRFVLFKGLFRNFGTTFLPHFIPHLQRLVTENHESSQRCAAEVIAGFIRGSKHWPFHMVEQLQATVEPILRTALSKVTVETVTDWGTCIATASENGDPNRLHWLFNLLMEDPMRSEEGSFAEASRLYVLQGGIAQQEWRVAELLHNLLEYLKPYLTHPYQNVRFRLGSVLTNIFLMDIDLPGGLKTHCPRRKEFVESLLPQLSILETELNSSKSNTTQGYEIIHPEVEDARGDSLLKEKNENHKMDNSFLENSDRKIAVSLLKTVCKWFQGNVSRASYTAPPEFFHVLPLLCQMESNDSDEELKQDCVVSLLYFGQAYLTPSNIQIAINTLSKIRVCKSWRARASSLGYLQVMVFSNLFSVLHNEAWVKEIREIVFGLLEDERVEVREMAGITLGGMFHCEFIQFTDELMNVFRNKSGQKLRKSKNRSEPVSPEAVVQRHAGILGLCAYVNAHPYDVPEKIPDILMILGDHLNDPQPIPLTVKKTLSNFRRTHYDSWRDHKLKFSDDQLAVLTDLLVSPSYYA